MIGSTHCIRISVSSGNRGIRNNGGKEKTNMVWVKNNFVTYGKRTEVCCMNVLRLSRISAPTSSYVGLYDTLPKPDIFLAKDALLVAPLLVVNP